MSAESRGGARRCLPLAALLALSLANGAAAQSPGQVEVVLDGELYVVRASAQVAADQRVVWETLTDYGRLREFVPGVTQARVLWRSGNHLTIEQIGVFSVVVLDLPVKLRLAVQHTPYTNVLARLVTAPLEVGESTLRSFTGRYSLTPIILPQGPGVRLDYDASFALAQPLPPIIGSLFGIHAVRRTMHEQFGAMLREIERRQAAAGERDG
ncbi:SRPBCC family protein [Accumulibacter sp.]|uniref:SRPBCC family protein n=1 Tax=Accumulibacter sp. TaxID=2053492 RepID=UPI00261AE08C|nr:SRPBCC family protein [Accumulibacter sp.]